MQIQHEPEQKRFIATLDEQEALLEYRYIGDEGVDFHHTFVPPAFRGQSVAAKLVDAATEWADEKGLAIQASCSYALIRLKRRSRV